MALVALDESEAPMPTKGFHLWLRMVVDLSTFWFEMPVGVTLESVHLGCLLSALGSVTFRLPNIRVMQLTTCGECQSTSGVYHQPSRTRADIARRFPSVVARTIHARCRGTPKSRSPAGSRTE